MLLLRPALAFIRCSSPCTVANDKATCFIRRRFSIANSFYVRAVTTNPTHQPLPPPIKTAHSLRAVTDYHNSHSGLKTRINNNCTMRETTRTNHFCSRTTARFIIPPKPSSSPGDHASALLLLLWSTVQDQHTIYLLRRIVAPQ